MITCSSSMQFEVGTTRTTGNLQRSRLKMTLHYTYVLILATILSSCSAFVPRNLERDVALAAGTPTSLHMLPDLSFLSANTLTTAVDVFDGSGVDPVVVSNVFWSRLQGNFLSVLIGNFLAAVVFAFIMSQASTQLSKLGSFVTENIFKDKTGFGGPSGGRASTTFRRADELPQTTSPPVDIDLSKLLLCIAIDVIGSASELVPVLGELTDVVWAPIAGLALRSLYGSNVLFALEFAEEILPFTDILPLATLCWVIDTFYGDSDLAKALGLGRFGQAINGSNDAIDVEASLDLNRRLPSESDSRSKR